MHQHSIYTVPEVEEKKKRGGGYEKIFEEIIVENFPNMEKEIVLSLYVLSLILVGFVN